MHTYSYYEIGKGIEGKRTKMRATYEEVRCKYCNSPSVVMFGSYRGVQRWWCKVCKRKFVDNKALFKMQTSTEDVAAAIGMYYEGMSLNAIARQLQQTKNEYVANSTIYRWINRFSKIASEEAEQHKPTKLGNTWIADETVLKIGGKNVWFWDIIDAKTRFLLASHISVNRGTKDAKILMEKAQKRAGKTPSVVLTDKLASYLDGIELAFGADTKHIQSKPFTVENSTNIIERFHGTLKDRTKVMRGIKTIETAGLLTDGWLVYYNFLRPHSALEQRTPAEEAGIKYPYRNWLDVVRQKGNSGEITYDLGVQEVKPVKYEALMKEKPLPKPRRRRRRKDLPTPSISSLYLV